VRNGDVRKTIAVGVACVLLGGALVGGAPAAARTYYCFGQKGTIVGTTKGEDLLGTPGPDVIVARGGNDFVRGDDGDDLICGGRGDDGSDVSTEDGTVAGLEGGEGDDWIKGGPGNDDVSGDAGTDVLYGGLGHDTIADYWSFHEYAGWEPAPGSDDMLFGGPGHDSLTSTGGDDIQSGGAGNDGLGRQGWGWDWEPTEVGSRDFGFDTYLGGDGDDRITTADDVGGNDTTNAGPGTDLCSGDQGDVFGGCEG
jgi:hypothetical protein